jgi:stage IV sporulation protein FB
MSTLVDYPQGDRGDWSFRLAGIPVRVAIWFWIVMLIAGSQGTLAGAVIWVAAGFVSILLHETGHVLVFRWFGCRAGVVLYAFGGLTIPDRDVVGMWPKALVALAGPLAGFCLAGLTILATALNGGHTWLIWHMFLPHVYATFSPQVLGAPHHDSVNTYGTMLVNDLLLVNFYWGLVNLLPVWPLDGGHVLRALLERWDSVGGRRKSLIVSAVTASAVALAAVANQNMWLVIIFGIFAASSMQAMGDERRRTIPYQRWRDST